MINEWLANLPPEIAEILGYSRLIGAGLILLAGFVASKIVQAVVKGLLMRLAAKTSSQLDEGILALIQKPLWQTIVLFSAALAIAWLNQDQRAQFVMIGLIESLVLLIWLVTALRLTSLIFGALGKSLAAAGKAGADLAPLLANLVRVVIIVGSIMAVLSVWEVDITPLLASAGIAGVAVALAAKDTLANFFGGVSVFIDRPYKIGDYINLSTGERGEVVDIGIRSTRIQTRDDIQIIIPNATIAASKIVNESAPEPRFRTRIKVGVAYGSDLDLVEKILLEASTSNELVAPYPEPRVRFRTFGDSSLDYELLCWLEDPRDRGRAIHAISRRIYDEFNRQGVVIPFPQMDVHLNWAGPAPSDSKEEQD